MRHPPENSAIKMRVVFNATRFRSFMLLSAAHVIYAPAMRHASPWSTDSPGGGVAILPWFPYVCPFPENTWLMNQSGASCRFHLLFSIIAYQRCMPPIMQVSLMVNVTGCCRNDDFVTRLNKAARFQIKSTPKFSLS